MKVENGFMLGDQSKIATFLEIDINYISFIRCRKIVFFDNNRAL